MENAPAPKRRTRWKAPLPQKGGGESSTTQMEDERKQHHLKEVEEGSTTHKGRGRKQHHPKELLSKTEEGNGSNIPKEK